MAPPQEKPQPAQLAIHLQQILIEVGRLQRPANAVHGFGQGVPRGRRARLEPDLSAYLARAAAAGMTWPLPDDLDDAALEAGLALFSRRDYGLRDGSPAVSISRWYRASVRIATSSGSDRRSFTA